MGRVYCERENRVYLCIKSFGMSPYYYQNKEDLAGIIGEKMAFINRCLAALSRGEDIPVKEVREAIVFLKDHKYLFTGQGLNQLEFFIRQSEEALKGL